MCQLFIVLHSSVQGKSIAYKVGLLIKRLTKKRSEFSTGFEKGVGSWETDVAEEGVSSIFC